MKKSTILVQARFTVKDDRREEFEQVVAELTARAEGEPGTLTFHCFRGAPGRYSVIEEYTDADAALAHQAANQDLLTRAAGCTAEAAMDLHGPVGAVIRAWAQSDPTVTLYEDTLPRLG